MSNEPVSNISIGRLGEEIAEKYLKKRGYEIIERNFRSKRWGEIDLVAIENDVTVFVEVKTRLSTDYGEPQEAVTPYKLQTLTRAGQYYKLQHPNTPAALRVDVVAIILNKETGKPSWIRLFRDARW